MEQKNKFTHKDIQYILMVIFSSLIYSIGMNVFVKSGNLFPGGYAGISRLLSLLSQEVFGFSISFSIIYFTLNALTAILIWKQLGHKFVIRSILWFTLTSIFTAVLPNKEITSDPLLISVFGGLINGTAMGIALKANASSGGTDFIAMEISARYNRPAWNYIFCLNLCVLVIAGLKYGWTQSLYSIIFQYVSTQMVNGMHQRYRMTNLQVVTDRAPEVTAAVFKTVRHGITELQCEGEYSHKNHKLLMITISNDQRKEVVHCIREADPHAFIAEVAVERVIGNYYQKPMD